MKGEKVISSTFAKHMKITKPDTPSLTMIAQAPNTNWSELLTSALWPKSTTGMSQLTGLNVSRNVSNPVQNHES